MDEIKLKITEKKVDENTVRYLLANGKEQSATFTGRKKYELVSEYSKEIVNEIKKYNCENILIIGGGGFSIPKFMISNFPKCRIDVVEKSREVYEIAKRKFYLSELIEEYKTQELGRMNVHIMSGEKYLHTSQKKYDLIINDAYDGGEMASGLLTPTSVKMISEHLENHGVYLINFFAALEGSKKIALEQEKEILSSFFSGIVVRQVDCRIDRRHRQNCLIIAKKRSSYVEIET